MKELINIVWFKRDLRIHDHQPLLEAANGGKVLPLYVVEPDYWELPDHSNRQWDFIRQSLIALDAALKTLGQGLIIQTGDVVEVLQSLHNMFDIQGLYSHQESGNGWTFERDKAVAKWCRSNQLTWHEYKPYGVVRRVSVHAKNQ